MKAPHEVVVGDRLPERRRRCDIVQSFLYNAALWNAHRIHYELDYARDVEGYPGLVVPGPLLGDWLGQLVDDWVAGSSAELVRLEYTNRLAAYVGDEVVVSGEVSAVQDGAVSLELSVINAEGDVITPGRAVIRLR